jgi:hypothetical protein
VSSSITRLLDLDLYATLPTVEHKWRQWLFDDSLILKLFLYLLGLFNDACGCLHWLLLLCLDRVL